MTTEAREHARDQLVVDTTDQAGRDIDNGTEGAVAQPDAALVGPRRFVSEVAENLLCRVESCRG